MAPSVNKLVAAVVGVTLLALALRIPGLRQSLFGDELFTYYVTESGLGAVFDRMSEVESNPPLFYLLAWVARRIGDPDVWIRLPSLVAGIGLIPLVGVLGARLAGRAAGLTAAALIAASPFAVFFATEARAYALLMFLVALSTLALLNAVERRSRRWWVVFAAAGAAALYTHYTAVFPLAAQGLWALWFHRDQLRALVLAHAAIAVLFVPWIPQIRENEAGDVVGGSFDLTAGTALTALLRSAFGHPIEAFDELPATAGIVALAAAAAVAVVGAVMGRAGNRSGPDGRTAIDRRGGAVLIAGLVVVAPLGLLAYKAVGGGDLYLPRNLSSALPALAIGIAWAAWSLPRPFAIAATVLVLGGAIAGSGLLVADDDHARPDFRSIAEVIDERAQPGDTVVTSPIFFFAPLHRGLDVHLERRHREFLHGGVEQGGSGPVGKVDPAAWRVPRGGRVFVAGYERPGVFPLPVPPRGSGPFRVLLRRTYAGITPLTLVIYQRG
jgi:hypothetical protein